MLEAFNCRTIADRNLKLEAYSLLYDAMENHTIAEIAYECGLTTGTIIDAYNCKRLPIEQWGLIKDGCDRIKKKTTT